MERLEGAAEQLRKEMDADLAEGSRAKYPISSAASALSYPRAVSAATGSAQSNLAEVGVELNLPRDYSGVSTRTYANRWRELTGGIPDAIELGFTSEAFGIGKAIAFELYGKDFDELRTAAAELRTPCRATTGSWMSATHSARASRKYS